MILELDLGNTRAKWRILNAHMEVIARGAEAIAQWLSDGFPAIWSDGIQRVRIASVLSSETEFQLLTKIQAEFSISAEMARSSPQCDEIKNAYADAARLGVDRWLAVIAAFKKVNRAVMVIDAGTALKVDAVDDAGLHLGGYIIPGPQLMERALFSGTDRVRYQGSSPLESFKFGGDTRACVQNGITAALTGALLVAIKQCQSISPSIYITGGLGLQMQSCLAAAGIHDVQFEADLVLDGLRWVLP